MTRKPVSRPAPHQMSARAPQGCTPAIRVRAVLPRTRERRHLWPNFRIAIWVGGLCHVGEVYILLGLMEMDVICDVGGA